MPDHVSKAENPYEIRPSQTGIGRAGKSPIWRAWALFQLMTSPLDDNYQSIPSKAIQLLAQSLGYPVILVIAMVV